MREDIAGDVHFRYYGKSDKINALENQNREFQDGYSAGVDSLGFDARKVIEEEFSLRDEIGDDLGDGALEWVRGFWAARSQLAAAGVKKQRKYGKYILTPSERIAEDRSAGLLRTTDTFSDVELTEISFSSPKCDLRRKTELQVYQSQRPKVLFIREPLDGPRVGCSIEPVGVLRMLVKFRHVSLVRG
jgi:hypothetical protein